MDRLEKREGVVSGNINALTLLKHTYSIISQVYAEKKEFETAYQYHQLYTVLLLVVIIYPSFFPKFTV